MIDLKLETPVSEEVEVDEATWAAIEKGIHAADDGRTVPLDEVRKKFTTKAPGYCSGQAPTQRTLKAQGFSVISRILQRVNCVSAVNPG